MAKTSSLRAAVDKAAASLPAAPGSWLSRMPEDLRKELMGIKADWRSGKILLSCRRLAIALRQACRERGIAVPGEGGVRTWLAKEDN